MIDYPSSHYTGGVIWGHEILKPDILMASIRAINPPPSHSTTRPRLVYATPSPHGWTDVSGYMRSVQVIQVHILNRHTQTHNQAATLTQLRYRNRTRIKHIHFLVGYLDRGVNYSKKYKRHFSILHRFSNLEYYRIRNSFEWLPPRFGRWLLMACELLVLPGKSLRGRVSLVRGK